MAVIDLDLDQGEVYCRSSQVVGGMPIPMELLDTLFQDHFATVSRHLPDLTRHALGSGTRQGNPAGNNPSLSNKRRFNLN